MKDLLLGAATECRGSALRYLKELHRLSPAAKKSYTFEMMWEDAQLTCAIGTVYGRPKPVCLVYRLHAEPKQYQSLS